jgi:hypothetical protein
MTQPPPLSPEEKEQVLQTIEMFGVIVQASPNDAIPGNSQGCLRACGQ